MHEENSRVSIDEPKVLEAPNGHTPRAELHIGLSSMEAGQEKSQEVQCSGRDSESDYCVLSEREKISLMLLASFAALISPISSSIYLPAVNSLSRDLQASISAINLTISTYLIVQGIAPSFTAAFSENYGRRPAYLLCFIIYIGANIGLALQSSYAALLVLRCMQSLGSSGTVALGSAVVADLSTRAERGKYIGYTTMGVTLGPALGPVIGGLFEHFQGWRSIFWFLVILCGILAIVLAVVFPETCRSIVGNNSIKPARWNRSLLQVVNEELRQKPQPPEDWDTLQKTKRRPNPINSLKILANRETCVIALFGALLYAGYMSVLSVLTSQLQERFGFNSIQIGLSYLPLGAGSLTSRWTVGVLLDRNFRREARKQGLEIVKNRQQDISGFDIEKARLLITMPFVIGACFFIIAYGWTMQYRTSLAAPLVVLFFMGHLTTGAFSSLSTLVVDINRDQPATASAANNLLRCLIGAGAVAAATPVINSIGIGWAATICAFAWMACFPFIWLVYSRGYRWRTEKTTRENEVSVDNSV